MGTEKEVKVLATIKKYKKLVIVGIVALVAIAIGLSFLFSKVGSVTTISEASLKEVLETSELSTIQYTYNSTFLVSEQEQNKKIDKYYVAYKGKVKAGFDFDEIQLEENKENKKVVVVVPEIKIQSVNVDEDVECIFIKEKYHTETVYHEAYSKSIEDLKNKAKENKTLLTMARDNAISTVKALIKPWEDQLVSEGYTVEVK